MAILFSQNSGEGLHNTEVAEEITAHLLQIKRKPRALLLLPGCLGVLRTDRTGIQNSFIPCKTGVRSNPGRAKAFYFICMQRHINSNDEGDNKMSPTM